jgi:biotin-(acetyl-CoA carboxylase) ligase
MLEETAARGFEAAPRARFERFFRMRGRAVTVTALSGETLAGVAAGIASDGALLVETSGGRTERVLAGDVTLRAEGLG